MNIPSTTWTHYSVAHPAPGDLVVALARSTRHLDWGERWVWWIGTAERSGPFRPVRVTKDVQPPDFGWCRYWRYPTPEELVTYQLGGARAPTEYPGDPGVQ